ncbi:efflux RND transporter periplasmic adaptor subunit [Sphingomonas oligoaromativorans]|uniref:efflux RND transporter periplasmic adaptor subunit n=1 Tax=Sphingomonas oligoaromativorans TaxID=575322 RepID=UPI00141E93AE|nr:efflux RND transporter periplasmic adaptor subunit [Sphingomonas oligoaromativorans]NIJ33185.1 membrane fusion protein (multidrug efflux system) [Sphingomonas oligoaromativorans]
MIGPASPRSTRILALSTLLTLAACGGDRKQPPKPTPTVGVVVARPETVAIDTELPGRTDAYLISDVRPQVSGVVLKRLFTEGSLVREGQPLYLIDPALYRAAVGQAQGQLASAEANAVAARLKAERYSDLEKINAVARQDAADARAAAGQAEAAIQQQKAALDTARINLRYTSVLAPISGRISRSSVTPGALVTAGQTTALATITTLDPIYVDIQQSSTELLQLRKAIAAGGALPNEAAVRLKLEDGSDYPETGKLEFSEVNVDIATGAVTLRARFPNRQGLLLPGMYVRAVVSQALRKDAFLLPEAAVVHDPRGAASVLVVGPDDKIVKKLVTDEGLHRNRWIVTQGIAPGDRVVIEGSGKARPGQAVHAVLSTGSQAEAAAIDPTPAAGKGKDGRSGVAR